MRIEAEELLSPLDVMRLAQCSHNKAIRLMKEIGPCLYVHDMYEQGKRYVPRIRTQDWNTYLRQQMDLAKRPRQPRTKPNEWAAEELKREREHIKRRIKERP